MGSLYRSEEMCRCQLFLQTEAAYACVAELGELGLVQFRDLNPDVNAFQRKFVNEVRRCDEMERKLRFLEKEIKKDKIPILDTGENPDAPQPREMIDLEATFEKLENELREVNTNEEMLKKNFLELTELKHILRKTQTFFDEGMVPTEEEMADAAQMAYDATNLPPAAVGMTTGQHQRGSDQLRFVAGVILRERLPAFERLLWRACRGNVFLRQTEITDSLEDPVTGDQVKKCVFIIFFQGDQLKSRVKKICEGFRATLYPCPETPQERREMAIGVMTRIEDLKTVLGQTQDHRHRVLVAAAKNIRIWFTKVRKIKSVYHTLNLFNLDVTQKCLIAECWCPVSELDKIQLALKRGTEESGSSVPSILNRMESDEPPPTYHRTNKFTAGFQTIVDAYGIANYREVNPAPYTIITFPFLFAVMFGDLGHGILMMLFALFMVVKEKALIAKKINDEIFVTFFGGRYIILLMGIFSMYTGIIYNDIYAKSFNIFGSSWKDNYTLEQLHGNEKLQYNPNETYVNYPYPFGIDPMWNLAENKLNFLNSFKMKMSVILGIFHMMFGVVLSLMNYRYFRQPLDVYCQFIPQILFLSCIFLYLSIMIFYKWTHFSVFEQQTSVGIYRGPHCAPSLLIGLINMFMFKDRQSGFEGPLCYLNTYYAGQNGMEKFLVVIALLCVPAMLFGKPYFIYKEHQRKTLSMGIVEKILVIIAVLCVPCMLVVKPLVLRHQNKRMLLSVRADVSNDDAQVIADGKQNGSHGAGHGGGHGAHGGKFEFSEVFIHQAIHTIEFCLGCISHTASYLRLWALSLAHAQLSEVLWGMVMKMAFKFSGLEASVLVYFIFMAFGVLTLCVLVVMEGLSAFLHALRLHWVEFQSKFYTGSGYAFMPFSFDVILEQAQNVDE